MSGEGLQSVSGGASEGLGHVSRMVEGEEGGGKSWLQEGKADTCLGKCLGGLGGL